MSRWVLGLNPRMTLPSIPYGRDWRYGMDARIKSGHDDIPGMLEIKGERVPHSLACPAQPSLLSYAALASVASRAASIIVVLRSV